MFIIFFIHNDVGHVPCKPFMIMNYGFDIVSWAFASLIILLRVIAIWDYNRLVSSISFSAWSTAFGFSIRTLWQIGGQYDPEFEVCFATNTHSSIISAAAIPAADTILLLLMFFGLLRRAHGCKVGIWNLLYKQCTIWMIVAALVEIPPLVFMILNLNAAWNGMFPAVSVAILSICAARMYRSLCEQGNLTEYATSDPPHLPFPNRHHHHFGRELNSSPLHFHHVRTTSGVSFPETERGGGMVAEPFVLVPTAAELMQQAVSAGAASFPNTTIAVPAKSKSRDGYRLSWHRPVDPTARSFD